MNREEAKSKVMTIYGSLSEDMKQAIDVLVEDHDLSGYSKRLWQAAYERGKAEGQEQKTGHWEWQMEDIYRCSECGEHIHVKEVLNVPQYEWCPICGAHMREVNG